MSLTITNNNYKPSFRAVPVYTNAVRNIGELKFSTKSSVGSILRAVKEILKAQIPMNMTEKLKMVLEKYSAKIDEKIVFSSLLGAASTLTLYLQKQEEKDALGIITETPQTMKREFIIQEGKVNEVIDGKHRPLTQKEVDKLGLEKFLNDIVSMVDFPLLQIRQALLPEFTPRKSLILLSSNEKLEKKTVKTEKAEVVVEEVKEKTQQERPFSSSVVRLPREGFYNTGSEVDTLLKELTKKAQAQAVPKPIPSLSGKEEGQLTQGQLNKLEEVISLFGELDDISERRGNGLLKLLHSKCPIFDSYKKGSYLNLKNVGDENLNIGFFISHNKRVRAGAVYTIFIRDNDGSLLDVIPINNGKVLQVKPFAGIKKSKRYVDLVAANKYMSQKEVASKDIEKLLSLLKIQLEKILTCDDTIGAEIDASLANAIAEAERRFTDLNVELSLYKTFRDKPFHKHKKGGYMIKDIDSEGNNLLFTPASENKEIRGATAFRYFDKSGKFLYGFGIKDGKILSNYPCKSFSYAMHSKFCNAFEIEEQELQSKIEKSLELLNKRLEITEKALKTHKKIRELVESSTF